MMKYSQQITAQKNRVVMSYEYATGSILKYSYTPWHHVTAGKRFRLTMNQHLTHNPYHKCSNNFLGIM